MKLNMEKFERKKEKAVNLVYKPKIRHELWMILLNIITICIGVYVSYYMYARAGIIDPFGLVTFILGITLSVIGFERVFVSIADLIVLLQNRSKHPYYLVSTMGVPSVNMVNGLGFDTKGLTVNILSEGIELKYDSFTKCECIIPYERVFKVILNESLGGIYIFFKNNLVDYDFDNLIVDGYPYDGVLLNDLFDGFNWDDVLALLKLHLNPSCFDELDMSESEMDQLMWHKLRLTDILMARPDEEVSSSASTEDSKVDSPTENTEESKESEDSSEGTSSDTESVTTDDTSKEEESDTEKADASEVKNVPKDEGNPETEKK